MVSDYIAGYQHIGIPTDKFEESVKYYHGLGFSDMFDDVTPDGNRIKFVGFGNIIIECFERNVPATEQRGAVDHIAFECKNVNQCYQDARQAGYCIVEGPCFIPAWEHGTEYFMIQGPNAEVFELSQKFMDEDTKERAQKELEDILKCKG